MAGTPVAASAAAPIPAKWRLLVYRYAGLRTTLPATVREGPRTRNRLGLQHMKVWSDGAPITRENSRVPMLLCHCGAAADNPACGGPLEQPGERGSAAQLFPPRIQVPQAAPGPA